MNIGEKIHNLRKKNRISVNTLAKRTGATIITVRSWEKGDVIPDFNEIPLIAKALGVSVDTFLDNTEYYSDTDLLTSAYDDHKEKNKVKNIVITLVLFLLVFVIGDTIVALALHKSPILSWKTPYLGSESYVKRGLFIDSFYCLEENSKITLTQKIKLSGYNCPGTAPKKKTNKEVSSIIDTSKEKEGFKCSSALELFYEDDNYEYYFECINSSYVIVTYYNDQKENVKKALTAGKITINDLDEYDIDYLKKAKINPDS